MLFYFFAIFADPTLMVKKITPPFPSKKNIQIVAPETLNKSNQIQMTYKSTRHFSIFHCQIHQVPTLGKQSWKKMFSEDNDNEDNDNEDNDNKDNDNDNEDNNNEVIEDNKTLGIYLDVYPD